jgi:hypothetical protein
MLDQWVEGWPLRPDLELPLLSLGFPEALREGAVWMGLLGDSRFGRRLRKGEAGRVWSSERSQASQLPWPCQMGQDVSSRLGSRLTM